ncbi:MAG: diguanylate cyclase [Planctomycetota bacterium]|nr:diguanylate cyclase [Planctomycetota bacterium]
MKLWITSPKSSSVVIIPEHGMLTVGRDSNNDITLDDDQISRHHVRFLNILSTGLTVIDLQSSNGTFVNGVAIERSFLTSGDVVTIGQSSVQISSLEATKAPSGSSKRLLKVDAEKSDPELSQVGTMSTRGLRYSNYHLKRVKRETRPFKPKQILAQPSDARLQKLILCIQKIASELDVKSLFETTLDAFVDYTQAKRGLFIQALSNGGVDLKLSYNFNLSEIPNDQRLRLEAMTRLLKDQNLRHVSKDVQTDTIGECSHLLIPLISKNQRDWRAAGKRVVDEYLTVYGYIYLDNPYGEFNLSSTDFEALEALAAQAAIALQNSHLYRLATIEQLTGLLNRHTFEKFLSRELNRVRRQNSSLALIMLDIDHFKRVNDTHGHQVGDVVLKQCARQMKNALRREDLVGRYGGEEFIVCLTDVNTRDALNIAEKIRSSVEDAILSEKKLKITISLGVAMFPEHGKNSQFLIKCADEALYYAKNSGRNRVELWNAGMDVLNKEKDHLTSLLSGESIRDQQRMRTTLTVQQQLGANTINTTTLGDILGLLLEDFHADSMLLFIGSSFDEMTPIIRSRIDLRSGDANQYSRQILQNVVLRKQSFCSVPFNVASGMYPVFDPNQTKSAMAVPVIYRDELFGVIYVEVDPKKYLFKPGDQAFLELVASQLAYAFKVHKNNQLIEQFGAYKNRIAELEQQLANAQSTKAGNLRRDTERVFNKTISMTVPKLPGVHDDLEF